MDDETDAAPTPDEALLERLRVIEQQPLAERPASYAALHDELLSALEPTPGTGPE